MHLFTGSSHPALAKTLCTELNIQLGNMTCKRFSSGECYVKFEETIRGKRVYLLQAPGQHPDESIMELLMMCQAAKLSFAESVHVILPQFPYARQDRVSEPREPISAKLIADMLQSAGADHIITLALHSPQIQGFFSIPVDVLDTRAIFVDYFTTLGIEKPVVVSPDAGGAKQAKKFADILEADLAIMHKHRSAHQTSDIIDVVGDVEGRNCILYDDMIDTGGSIASAKEALLNRGAASDIYVAATHALLSGQAVERLKAAKYKEIVVTDSIAVPTFPSVKILSIAPLLAQVIENIERGESVTKIYNNIEGKK